MVAQNRFERRMTPEEAAKRIVRSVLKDRAEQGDVWAAEVLAKEDEERYERIRSSFENLGRSFREFARVFQSMQDGLKSGFANDRVREGSNPKELSAPEPADANPGELNKPSSLGYS